MAGRRLRFARGGEPAVVALGLGLAAFLLVSAWWTATVLGREHAVRRELDASYATRTAIQETFSLLQDAQTGQRGYVITGDPAFLQPYRRAVDELGRNDGELDRLLAEEPAQRARLERLRALRAEKLLEIRRVIALYDTAGPEAARAAVSAGRGKALMDQIRVVVGDMVRAEAAAIDRRVAESRARERSSERVVAVLLIGLILGAGVTLLIVLRYLGARHRALSATEAEAASRRAVFDAAIDAIVVLDRQGRIESINPAAERIFGLSAAQAAGLDAVRLLDAPEGARFFEALQTEAFSIGAGVRRDATGRRADGKRFPMEAALVETQADAGGRVVAFLRDVSEQRQVERLKDEFVSTVSHELRTPLTSIAGSLGLVAAGAAGPLPDKAQRLVGIAQANSQRLVRLINDILDLAKIERGEMPFAMQPLTLLNIARRAADAVQGYAEELGVTVELPRENGATVRGDVDRLTQVVTNLLSNAVKFSPRGGTVSVAFGLEAGRARISVRDRGPGVPEAFRDRLFSRFAQADSSQTRGKSGTGLGLYIAREIAERHGGRLWYQSPPDGGALFHLDLPAVEEPEARRPKRDRVLLVEDDAIASAVLTDILTENGLQVDAVETLAAARAALSSERRHGALVLDMRLPDGDGMDLVREVRVDPELRGMPIVVVSGEAARRRDTDVRALEVVDWMEKPVDPDRLAELVRAAVRKTAPDVARVLLVDDDADLRQVVRATFGDSVELEQAGSLAAARAALAAFTPDAVILDIELEDGLGSDLLPELQGRDRPIPVVIFTAQDEPDVEHGGAVAVLVKSRSTVAELVAAVKGLPGMQRGAAA
jgi:PAS domain S-box-containing protein